ncbi:MAG: GntR family transcriptional regulator [Parvularculaceae bacterium]|nr:GntR family transcriptional regulator [Parvularculaceae bacterium]
MAKAEAVKKPQGKAGAARAPVVHEEVFERLRRAIIAGHLEPGRALSVRGLATEFGVSAMPAREAIRRLVALNALELTPTRRVMVAQMSPGKIDEITEARIALEPLIAVRALKAVGDDEHARDALVSHLSVIDDALDEAISQGDAESYSRLNSDFHFALYETARAPVLLGLVESLWLQVGPFMRVVVGRLGTTALVDQHKQAIEALQAGDARKLKSAVRLDILEGMKNIRGARLS